MGKRPVALTPAWWRKAGTAWQFPLRLLAFWLLFFAAFRLWFILWSHAEWPDPNPWPAMWRALPLDLSMAGYLLALPVLFWFVGLVSGERVRRVCNRLVTGLNVFVFALFVLVFGVNVFLYQEWHTPINNRALQYFQTPESLLNSMSMGFKFAAVGIFFGFSWLWWWVYRRLIGTQLFAAPASWWHLSWLPVQVVLLVLAIRGGLGVMPINESAVYYSPHLFNNHAATNAAWHVLHSMIETRSTENHYRVMPDAEARARKQGLFPGQGAPAPTHDWLRVPGGQQPNVVVIIMESMTAQVVEELGGEKGVCPTLSRLAAQGLSFDHCYGSGYRTDQGLVSVLGGFPAQPDQSIVLLQDKAAHLPSVPKMLKEAGYNTAFFYGGELTFANIGVWLHHQQFDKIVSQSDFPAAEVTQRWGVDDERIFRKTVSTLNSLRQPFFANVLTLSLHSPFDVPYTSQWTGDTEREKFLNCAAFADYAIGTFMEQASHQPWYANTLFVLVADHGHTNPTGVRMDDPRSRQVPLILTGPVIAPDWRGHRIATIGNHHDIPATILNELGLPSTAFAWSKDLLDPSTTQFAYYTNENGLGWVTPAGSAFFGFQSKEWQTFYGTSDSTARRDAQAYLQTLYGDFLKM